jgi:F-type H+-transporting ATPase subunit delta
MVTGSLARRYAKAVFDLGNDHKNLDKLGEDLRQLAKVMRESAELSTVLSNPALRRAERGKVLDAILNRLTVQDHTRSLVYLLLDKERLASVPAISRELDTMIEAKAGRVSAEVVSAKPLSKQELEQIVVALEKLSGKKVSVEKREDPSLLGGVLAKVGDVVYDGSLRTQLRTLRDELTK